MKDDDKDLPQSTAIYDGITGGSLGGLPPQALVKGFADMGANAPVIDPIGSHRVDLIDYEDITMDDDPQEEQNEGEPTNTGFLGRPQGWER